MKIETALTAFCMTTVVIIVGLVMLTAVQLELTDSPIVGNYLGIPLQGKISRQSLPIAFASVDAEDPQCYAKATKECQRQNAGENFVICTDRAAVDCGLARTALSGCVLPAGYELKYLSKRECHYGVVDECKMRCSAGMQEHCVDASKSRCELIGGRFQQQRLQERHTLYPRASLNE
jgi:hypothetical protein